MLRDSFKKNIGMSKEFRYRGMEPGRLENFSDAVFALAITLLLISTSPPNNFMQLRKFAFDLLPFMMCITLIVLIWYEHFIFYYRYGLRNGMVVFLNAIFLVIVLFYVYPLKFLTKLFMFTIAFPFDIDWLLSDLKMMLEGGNMSYLMVIYGLGASFMFLILTIMYRYALSKRDELELNEIEIFDTRTRMNGITLMGAVPLVSAMLSLLFYNSNYSGMIAGFIYFSYGPILGIYWNRVNKKRNLLLEKLKLQETNENDEQH